MTNTLRLQSGFASSNASRSGINFKTNAIVLPRIARRTRRIGAASCSRAVGASRALLPLAWPRVHVLKVVGRHEGGLAGQLAHKLSLGYEILWGQLLALALRAR